MSKGQNIASSQQSEYSVYLSFGGRGRVKGLITFWNGSVCDWLGGLSGDRQLLLGLSEGAKPTRDSTGTNNMHDSCDMDNPALPPEFHNSAFMEQSGIDNG